MCQELNKQETVHLSGHTGEGKEVRDCQQSQDTQRSKEKGSTCVLWCGARTGVGVVGINRHTQRTRTSLARAGLDWRDTPLH